MNKQRIPSCTTPFQCRLAATIILYVLMSNHHIGQTEELSKEFYNIYRTFNFLCLPFLFYINHVSTE